MGLQMLPSMHRPSDPFHAGSHRGEGAVGRSICVGLAKLQFPLLLRGYVFPCFDCLEGCLLLAAPHEVIDV